MAPPTNVAPADIAAAVLFVTCWIGYGILAQNVTGKRTSLLSIMRRFRRRWIERMTERTNHIGDAALLSNLLRGEREVIAPRGEAERAVVAAFAISLAENLLSLVMPGSYKPLVPFALLLLVLYVRPQGLFPVPGQR